MTTLLLIHILAVGIWTGCVATEVVCEIDQKDAQYNKSYIAPLHWKIDKFVEIPAIFVALITGVLLLAGAPHDPILFVKIIAGILAVGLNFISAFTVFKRYKCYLASDEDGYNKYNRLHEFIGYGCLLAIFTALGTGIYYLV